jgi:hypothetical protein
LVFERLFNQNLPAVYFFFLRSSFFLLDYLSEVIGEYFVAFWFVGLEAASFGHGKHAFLLK